MKRISICAIGVMFFFSGCMGGANEKEYYEKEELFTTEFKNEDGYKNDVQGAVYQQNDAYKMFYGTWVYTDIISQHFRLGGDEGYESLIGMETTYTAEYFQCNDERVDNPTYLMTIGSIEDGYNDFFVEQEGLEQLLPNEEYFVMVQVVNKEPSVSGKGYIGTEFLLKDDDTMYAYDYNCIYELKRKSYINDFDGKLQYKERF